MVAAYTLVHVENEDKSFKIEDNEVADKVPELPTVVQSEVGAKSKDHCGAAYLPVATYDQIEPLSGPLNKDSGLPEPELITSSSTGSFASSWDDDDDDSSSVDESGPRWSELDCLGQLLHICRCVGRALALVALLYMFICSLDFLSSAFRILGGKTAGGVFTNSELLRNPVAGLMIGTLATVLVQSSSTSTSIIVTMVASGIIDVEMAIPIVMGANIGTSVTNTFVSMAQSSDRREFRRAFAGATVHDMFNWLTVIVLLPLEWSTGYLNLLTGTIVKACNLQSYKGGKQQLLSALTKPFTSLIVQVDKKVIEKVAAGDLTYANKSLIKKYCTFEERVVLVNATVLNLTNVADNTTLIEQVEKVPIEKCNSLFSHVDINETVAGVILLIFSLLVLCSCLVGMVKILNSLLQGSIAKIIKKTLNADFPGCFHWLTGYVAMLVGMVMTVLVQSSSVFTSALTPLVGVGMIKVERMYPLTLGSNIGTTGTGVLAAMAASGDKLPVALQIALCHLFFNISGIILFYPIPALRKIPIKCAKFLGSVTAEYRWFAAAYLVLMFLLLPASVFLISMAGTVACIVAASIIIPIIIFVFVLNVLQSKCKSHLPKVFQTWDFLPKPLRSLEPYDYVITKVLHSFKVCCPCCTKCCCVAKPKKPAALPKTNCIANQILKSKPHVKAPAVSVPPSCASSRFLLDKLEKNLV